MCVCLFHSLKLPFIVEPFVMESTHCPSHILDPVLMASDPTHHHLTVQFLLARCKGVAGIPAAIENGAFKIDMNHSSFDRVVEDTCKKAVEFDLLCLLYTQAQSSLGLCHSQTDSCSSLAHKKRLLGLMRIAALPHLRLLRFESLASSAFDGSGIQGIAAEKVIQQLEASLAEIDKPRTSEMCQFLILPLSTLTEALLIPCPQLSVSDRQLAELLEMTTSEENACLSKLKDYLDSGNKANNFEV